MPRNENTIDFIEFPARSISDLAAAKRFYGDVFGWSFKDWGDDYYIDTTATGDPRPLLVALANYFA